MYAFFLTGGGSHAPALRNKGGHTPERYDVL